LTKGNLIVILY